MSMSMNWENLLLGAGVTALAGLGFGGLGAMYYLFEVVPERQDLFETGAVAGLEEVSNRFQARATTPPADFDVKSSLEEDFGVEVSRGDFGEEEACFSLSGAVGGYYMPSSKSLCFSSAGKNTLHETLRHEAVHVLQFQKEIGVDEVSDFVKVNPYCSSTLSPSMEDRVERLYSRSEWEIEKQAHALQSQEKCVEAMLYHFN